MGPETSDSGGFVGIVIHTVPEWETVSLIAEVLYGIEEEQVPFWIVEKGLPTEDSFGSAHRAANRSVFGVGICCTLEEIAVHHSNLPKETPLFHFPLDQCTRKRARLLGANAARLIKVAPFEIP